MIERIHLNIDTLENFKKIEREERKERRQSLIRLSEKPSKKDVSLEVISELPERRSRKSSSEKPVPLILEPSTGIFLLFIFNLYLLKIVLMKELLLLQTVLKMSPKRKSQKKQERIESMIQLEVHFMK